MILRSMLNTLVVLISYGIVISMLSSCDANTELEPKSATEPSLASPQVHRPPAPPSDSPPGEVGAKTEFDPESVTEQSLAPLRVHRFSTPPADSRPGEVGSEILKQYHPVGQTREVALFGQVEGMASNQRWGFRGNYYIVADSTHNVVWEVLENDGRTMRFRVDVPLSHALLLASERRFSLHPPETPLFGRVVSLATWLDPELWAILETIKYANNIIQMVDPNYERLSTTVIEFLESRGLKRDEVKGLNMKIQRIAEDVEGISATLVYVDGHGITERVELTGADGLTQEVIDRIDRQLRRLNPVLTAYFLYPFQTPPGGKEVDTSVGAEWNVDASHVAGLFSAALEQDVEGTLRLRRQENTGNNVVLEIVRADIRYVTAGTQKATVAELHVRPGTTIHLEPDDIGSYRVKRGRIEGNATVNRHSTSHWLFEEQFQAEPTIRLHFHQSPSATP